jgi:hypothetical protein
MNFSKGVLSLISSAALLLPISLTNVQSASADQLIKQRYEGCSYTATYKAWWGSYTYLNACAITEVSQKHKEAAYILGLTGFAVGTKVKNNYIMGGLGVAGLVSGWNGDRLSYCKDTKNQAYIRYAFGYNSYITGNVSCD